ncbi:MAG: AraC family transcriptional regulator [Phyllobacteriaceae bacterium]|jgi:AraC family transcriptional regulator|nr:AraC family transcriptional regulator [Phyllobacteriaceae bacterium]
MPGLRAKKSRLPAGGGPFRLERLTLGVFLNDQPTHRLALGDDRADPRPLTVNQGWILPPGATGLCEFDQPLDVMMVEVDPSVLQEVGMDAPEAIRPQVGDFDPVTLQLSMAAEGFNEGGTLYRETMHRALAAQLTKTLAVRPEASQIGDVRLRRVVEYIHDNLAEDLTLGMMTDLAAMSGFHFSRSFRAATGKSPLQYVIAARIDMAKVLLKTTELTVAEIGYRVGYNDVSRFGQHFKRATGGTPAQFRAQ